MTVDVIENDADIVEQVRESAPAIFAFKYPEVSNMSYC